MTYKAYSLGIEKKDFELIRKIIKIITDDEPVIKDLRFYDIKSEDTQNSFVFIFGNKSSNLAKDISAKKVINLPEIIFNKEFLPNKGYDRKKLALHCWEKISYNLTNY